MSRLNCKSVLTCLWPWKVSTKPMPSTDFCIWFSIRKNSNWIWVEAVVVWKELRSTQNTTSECALPATFLKRSRCHTFLQHVHQKPQLLRDSKKKTMRERQNTAHSVTHFSLSVVEENSFFSSSCSTKRWDFFSIWAPVKSPSFRKISTPKQMIYLKNQISSVRTDLTTRQYLVSFFSDRTSHK